MAYGYVLADDEKRELLRIARATLKEYLASGRTPPGAPHRQSMREPAGVFVSIRTGDKLRGCVGQVAEAQPLYKAIQEMAIAAASRDPRFQPLAPQELATAIIEVSVLGERRVVKTPDEITIGKDGLQLTYGSRRGLLLPKVAEEHGWDAVTFLGKVCEKAGVAGDVWREPEAVIEAFTAQVFDEKSHPPLGAVVTIKK
jgi:hypothetical protein